MPRKLNGRRHDRPNRKQLKSAAIALRASLLGADRIRVSRSHRIDEGRSLRVRFNDGRTLEAPASLFMRLAYPRARLWRRAIVSASYKLDDGMKVRVHFDCGPPVEPYEFEAVDLHRFERELGAASELVGAVN